MAIAEALAPDVHHLSPRKFSSFFYAEAMILQQLAKSYFLIAGDRLREGKSDWEGWFEASIDLHQAGLRLEKLADAMVERQ